MSWLCAFWVVVILAGLGLAWLFTAPAPDEEDVKTLMGALD